MGIDFFDRYLCSVGMFCQIVAEDDYQNMCVGEKTAGCLVLGKLRVPEVAGKPDDLLLILNPVACTADRNRNCFRNPAI